jgi:hypothetical protein
MFIYLSSSTITGGVGIRFNDHLKITIMKLKHLVAKIDLKWHDQVDDKVTLHKK